MSWRSVCNCIILLSGLFVSLISLGAENNAQPNPYRLDFSGSWEKDYSRSDRWEDELDRQIRLMLQAQEQLSGGGAQSSRVQLNNVPRGRPAELVDLARFAETISRQNVIEITQNADQVTIQRQGDALLICGTRLDAMQSFSSPYGNEVCGWERQQLLFRITLPEGVDILHRFSVSPDGAWMNLMTSISRQGVGPFNLIQVFRRFDMPAGGDFNCVQTLDRGRVCSATGAPSAQ